MSTPKVLIDAQWRPDHFAAPVAPGFKATPLRNRMVPTIPAVSFINVIAPSTSVLAEGGHKLFLRRSVAEDLVKGTKFIPDEDAGSNPVEGSRQCVHGNTGWIHPMPGRKWPTPPLPGAINCGVIGSKEVDCLNNLEQMIELIANRLYNEMASDPIGFFKNFQTARMASNMAWGKALPGRIWDGAVDTVKGLWDGIKWVGGKAWDGVKATGNAIVHPVDTYNAAVQASSELMESAANAAKVAYEGAKTLLDPDKRAAVIEEIKNWLKAQLAGVACPAADALLDMMKSPEPLASQLGKLSAAIEQNVAEIGGQVAITVLGDKGISKLAMLSKAGKLGGLSEDLGKVMGRISERVAGKKPPARVPDPTDAKPKAPAIKSDRKPGEPETAGGARGSAANVACKTGCNVGGRPVNTAYGCKVLFGSEDLDFDLPAPLPLPWQRTYASDFAQTGWLGQGWSTPLSLQIQRVADGLVLIDEQGRRIPLPQVRLGEPYHSRFEQFVLAATEDGGFEIYPEGGDVHLRFGALGLPEDADAAARARAPLHVLTHLVDANGNAVQIVYGPMPEALREPGVFALEDAAALILPQGLIDSAGRHLRLDFAPVGAASDPRLPSQPRGARLVRVVQLTAPAERGAAPLVLPEPRVLVSYAYSDAGDLIEVRNALGQTTRQFAYANHVLVEHRDAAGLISRYEYTQPSPQGKVLRNWTSDARQWRFDYGGDFTDVTFTTADDPVGRTKRWFHDDEKNYTGHLDELGGRLERVLDSFANLTAITDEAGRTTRYTLNTLGLPIEITGADGAATRIAYHPTLGKITEVTDPAGAATRYQYDERGNLTAVTDALGHTTGYQHDARGLPIVITDASGKAKHLAYNAAGQLIRYTDCSGQSTQYGYDGWGHLSQITDALSQSTRYTHDALGHLLAVQHPDGAVERFDYDTAGRLIAYTDPLGATTRYELAADGLPITRTNAEGGQLVYEYDGARRLKTLLNENRARYDFGYDALDRLTLETGFDARHTRYRYDPTGLIEAKLEAGTLTAEERLAQQHQADGTTPIPPQRSAPTFEDPWGLGLSDADAPLNAPPGQQIATRYRRDAAGRLITKQVAGHVLGSESTLTPQHKTTRYRWDEAGRLIEATNSQGSKTTLAYDLLGQLTEETRTGQGLKSQLRHQYDALGNRIQTELPNGQHLSWLYYGSGHLHQISLDGHTLSDIERDALHRETLRTQGVLQSRYGYDALGRLTAQAAWRMAPAQAANTASATQRPGAWAALGDEIDPQAGRTTQGSAILGRRYQYDQAGNLKDIEDIRHGATRYGYDKIGQLLSAVQPSLTERFAFDPAHNMLPVVGDGKDGKNTATPTGSQGLIKNNRLEVFEDQRFQYDTHGNLIEKKIGKHTVIELQWDVEHQLQRATVTKAAQTQKPVKTETSYRYDAFGRRLEKKDGFGQTLFEWDGNRLLSEQRGSNHKLYVYEADSFAPLAQISLQADSRPKQPQVSVESAPAAIKLELTEKDDWQPRKTAQAFQEQMRALQLATMAKTRGQQVEQPEPHPDYEETLPPQEEVQDSGNVVSLKDWRVRYYHNDHLGTPRELSDEQGEIVWQATYKAWGNTLRVEAAKPQQLQKHELLAQAAHGLQAQNDPNLQQQEIEQNLRFQGQYFDQETGLHYNRFRYYDPDIGRFVSQDPIGLLGGHNSYAYAPNPVGWVDPSGLKSCWDLAREAYWMAKVAKELASPSGKYSANNLARMAEGKAPLMIAQYRVVKTGEIRTGPIAIELHHTYLPQRCGSNKAHQDWNLTEATPWGHQGMDPYRNTGTELLKILKGTNSF